MEPSYDHKTYVLELSVSNLPVGFWIGEGREAQYAPMPPDPSTLVHQGIITMGDWSNDGHGKYEMFKYTATHSIERQREAYYSAVEYFGLQFHDNGSDDPNSICVEWKDSRVNAYHMTILQMMAGISNTKFGVSPMGFEPTPILLAEMILWFISLMLSGFKHSPLEKTTQKEWKDGSEDDTLKQEFWDAVLNGWWNNGLNEQFGYGVFDTDNFYGTRRQPPDRSSYFEKKSMKLSKTNSIQYGRIIQDCYEIRVRHFHRDFLTADLELYYPEYLETNERLKEFILNAEARIFFARKRIWFESKKDAALFSLSFSNDFNK